MHKDVISKWCDALVIMICPICPHWAEKMWKQMDKQGFAVNAAWPIADEEDKILSRQAKFLRDALKSFRTTVGKAKKSFNESTVLVTDSYPEWKANILVWMQSVYDNGFPNDFMAQLKNWSGANISDKKLIKLAMQFASFTKKEVEEVGPAVMDTTLPFDQRSILEESVAYLKSQLNLENVNVIRIDDTDESSHVPDRTKDNVVPGKAVLWLH